jgi:cobalamin biosynthesis Co2+ chelatase CbiK
LKRRSKTNFNTTENDVNQEKNLSYEEIIRQHILTISRLSAIYATDTSARITNCINSLYDLVSPLMDSESDKEYEQILERERKEVHNYQEGDEFKFRKFTGARKVEKINAKYSSEKLRFLLKHLKKIGMLTSETETLEEVEEL